jgi:ribose/xylose/arabinose/galactoside ABC-type transport system permease subunit
MTSSAVTAAQPVARRPSLVQTLGLGRFTLLIVLLLIVAVTAIGNPRFLSVNNLLNILFQVLALGIVAAGQTILLIAGGLDLSVGAALSVAGLATALTIASTGSIALAALAGVVAGVAIGAVNGALIATNRATPFIITLGTMTFLQGVAILMSGGSPINGTGALFDVFGVGSFARVPWPVYVMLLSIAAVFLVLRFTTLGRYAFAIGGNEEASRLSGIPVRRMKIALYALNGLFVGVAGVILTGILTRPVLSRPDRAHHQGQFGGSGSMGCDAGQRRPVAEGSAAPAVNAADPAVEVISSACVVAQARLPKLPRLSSEARDRTHEDRLQFTAVDRAC